MARLWRIALRLHPTAARAAGLYLVFAALWIFASDNLLALFISDAAVMAKLGLAKGIAFVVITTLLLYLLLAGWGVRSEASPAAGPPAPAGNGPLSLVMVFLGLAVIVPLAGIAVVKLQGPRVEQNAVSDLRAIADLRGGQIESWLAARLGDAEVLAASFPFIEDIDRWQRFGNSRAKGNFVNRLESLKRVFHYEIELVDPVGRRILAKDSADPLEPAWLALLPRALDSGQVQVSEMYRDAAGRIRLDYVVPLILQEAGERRAIAVAVLRAPVEQFLFPLIQTWPTPSPSGETVLTRREGNDVLFLNELRHRPGAALSFRLPLAGHPQLPSAASILGEGADVVSGIDYRQIPVLAAVRPIQGTTWHLVAKLDRDEVLAPLTALIQWVGLIALVAVATVAVAVTLVWRQQQRANRLQVLAEAAEKDKLLKLFHDLPFVGVAIATPGSGQFLSVNDQLCAMLGYSREQLLDLGWAGITHPDDLAASTAEHQRILAGECDGFRLEKRYLKKDGQAIIGNVDVKRVRRPDGDGDVLIAMIQDITERKQAEERIRQAATVFESTRDGVIIADLEARILAVNKAFTDITGHGEAEVLGQNPRLLQSGRHDAEFYRNLWAELLERGQWQGEVWDRRKNGELYPTWTTITTVRGAGGRPTHYVCVFTDISQQKHSEAQLEHLAHYDPLTDLPNRLLLQSRLAHAIDRAERHGQRIAVIFIDLDHFKTVNDSFGHVVGDQLLVGVAKRISERVREEDTLGRLGGDEFLLVLGPIADPQEAVVVVRDLLATLAAPFGLANGQEVYIGASVGISVYPEDGGSAAELLRDADAAMYQAKEQGRNRFCFYTADMNTNAVRHLELEAALRRALERNEFVLHYQPKVDLRCGLVTGAEALIRWQRESFGLEAPGRFIGLAEKTGLIVPIGTWVIDESCRQLRLWRDAGWTDLRLAVNVSGRQFHAGDLAAVVAQALERHGVPPENLELEVTESMLMESPEQTVAILKTLKGIGVKLSLDDFGTGYSSFAYLHRFPIDTLKIDQSFVRNIVSDPDSAMIAVSIIDLAHRMHLKVVAEGVETEAQLGYLRQQRCDEIQGYFFGRPMPAADFAALLADGKALPGAGATASTATRTLLMVDDEPAILSSLTRLLRREGYRILTAGSAREGLELLAANTVQVVLSDQRMPEMMGTEFLGRVKDLHPDTVRIVLSGYADLESVTRSVNEGAIYKFLYKPWDDDGLRQHLRDAFQYHEAVIQPRSGQ